MRQEGQLNELRRNLRMAVEYVDELKSKRFKSMRDKKTLNYWEGYKAAMEKALFLAEFYSEYKEREAE